MARRWFTTAIILTGIWCVACDTSVFHKIPNRQQPTDTGCTPNQLPSDLRAIVFPGHIELRWADNSTNEHGYIVDRRIGTIGGPIAQLGPNASSYQDATIENDKEYSYRVRGYRIEGEQQCETRDAGPLAVHSQPYRPTDVATALPTSADEIVLTWTDDNELETGYVVQRLDDSTGVFAEVGTVDAQDETGNAMTLVDTGLAPATAYEYRIYTTNKDAASAPVGIVARTSNPPETEWAGDPYLTDVCELVLPGEVTYDMVMEAEFAAATATISRATVSTADGNGASAELTDRTAGTVDTSWSVTDSLGGQSEPLTRQLDLVVSATTRAADRRPASSMGEHGGAGQQALLPGCSTCTGRRGAIATGYTHSCVLTDAGRVSCWGNNFNGQIGNGRADEHFNPVRPCSDINSEWCAGPLDGIVDITVRDAACAVNNTGAVFCWGPNSDGRLGTGYSAAAVPESPWPTPVCLTGFAYEDDCVQLTGASVYGNAVAMGEYHTCALLATGNVMCWGDNGYGSLGNGLTDDQTRPTLVCATGDWDGVSCAGGSPLADVVAIAAGLRHTCAVVDNGTDRSVSCWGYNYYGQIGDGTGGSGTNRVRPEDVCATGASTGGCVPLTGVEELALGDRHSCAVLTSGELVCWGGNSYGQVGVGRQDGSSTRYTNPVPVCARGEWDGTMCDDGGVHAPLQNAVDVAALPEATCALLASGEIHCWGENTDGILGDGTEATRLLPAPVCASGTADDGTCVPLLAESFATGVDSACAILAGGAPVCWGNNGYGQLGIGESSNEELNPRAVCATGSTDTCERFAGATTVVVGDAFACAVDRVGGLGSNGIHCWGYNSSGQMGQGYSIQAVIPETVCTSGSLFDCVPLGRVVALEAGFEHTCALRDDGTVYCWGANTNSGTRSGQLGRGTASYSSSHALPVCTHADWDGAACEQGPLTGVVSLTAGAYHTCALQESGEPLCWGLNNCGQLGDTDFGACFATDDSGPVVLEPSPVCAPGTAPPLCVPLSGVAQIDSFFLHTCATMSNGEVLCWGANDFGQLGHGVMSSFTAAPTPVCAGSGDPCTRLGDVHSVTTGRSHTCALLDSGEMSCWGENEYGQLGGGVSPDRANPGPVCTRGTGASCVRLQSVVGITAGLETTCALLRDGGARCWGFAGDGALGTGTDGPHHHHPTPVCGPDADAECLPDPLCAAYLTDVSALSLGPGHACALLDDGGARCWGLNGDENRVGNAAVESEFFGLATTCVPVPVCEWGYGEESCGWGEVLGDLAVASCEVLEVVVP